MRKKKWSYFPDWYVPLMRGSIPGVRAYERKIMVPHPKWGEVVEYYDIRVLFALIIEAGRWYWDEEH